MTGRPATDGITDAIKYNYLTEAQNEIVSQIASRVPQVLYPHAADASYPTLSTTDNKIFTFGTDANGYAIAPIGKTSLYSSLANIPDRPMGRDVDYLDEGTQIRIAHDGSFAGTIYWRGVSPPADITSTGQPALFPPASRELIVMLAALHFAESGGVRAPELADRMSVRLGTPWAPNAGAFARWMLTWRTAFRNGGALSSVTGLQIALASQTTANDDGLYGDSLFGTGSFLPL